MNEIFIDIDLTETQEVSFSAIRKQALELIKCKKDNSYFLKQVLVLSELLELYVGSRSMIDIIQYVQKHPEYSDEAEMHLNFLNSELFDQIGELSEKAKKLLKRQE